MGSDSVKPRGSNYVKIEEAQLRISLTLFDVGFSEPSVIGKGEGGLRASILTLLQLL